MSTYKLNHTDSFGKGGDANGLRSNQENGFSNLSSLAQSEKAVQEFLIQQTPMQANDDHLIEFSEALRTVAKALRGSSEGKALAQAEAAEWKRRYELERCKNLELLLKAPSNGVCADESNSNGMMDHSAKSPRLHVQENGKSGMHSLERICAHEVLQDCEPNSPNGCNNKLKRKFFMTEPLACEPSELPKYPPTKEIDAKKRDEEYRRQKEARKVQGESGRRIRPRDRAPRAMPAPEANAENQSNIDRMRLITHANAKSKSEKFPPPRQDGSLGYQVGSSRRLDPSEIPFSSNSFTATYSKEPFQTWCGPLAPTEAHDSTAKRMKDINKERRKAAKLKGKRIVV